MKSSIRNKVLQGAAVAIIPVALLAQICCAEPPTDRAWIPLTRFSDEFESSALDASKWVDHNDSWVGRPPSHFDPSNVRVAAGHLILRANEDQSLDRVTASHTYSTSAVKSRTPVLYGYFEIRARPMKANISSAFWFYDANQTQWTEIDVFEIVGADQDRVVDHTNLHVFHDAEYQGTIAKHLEFPVAVVTGTVLCDSEHVYGLEWDAERIQWFFDGTLVRAARNEHWHQPLYLNLDVEVMADWVGLPAEADLPGAFSIDYVRAWAPVTGLN